MGELHVNYYENLGRNIFQNFLNLTFCTSILFSTNLYSKTDVEFTSLKNNKCIAEIKYRLIEAGEYRDLIIEKNKYEELKSNYLLKNKIPIYVTITNDNHIFIQDLREYIKNDSLIFEQRYLQVNDYELSNYKWKTVSYLPIDSPNTKIYKIDNSRLEKVNASDIEYIEKDYFKLGNEILKKYNDII